MAENTITEEEEFAKKLISSIVKVPGNVSVLRSEDEQGVLLTVRVDSSDMGLLIGRDGRNIASVKHILNLFGRNRRYSLNLMVQEPDKK